MSRRLAEGMQGGTHTDAAPAVDAVVALGANLGDRHETLAAAAAALEHLPLVSAVSCKMSGRGKHGGGQRADQGEW